MGFSSVRLVSLLLCCLQFCIWSVQGVSLYKMYPYDDQQTLDNLQENYFGNEENAEIVKRKPNNYKFFLKGLRGKRSALFNMPQQQMEQFQKYPSTFQS